MTDIDIRDLTSIEEFRQVVALEQAIWGYTDSADLVTVPVFIFTVHAVMGMKDKRPMQWSHMAGVLPEFRGGLGYRLKLAQRERALSQGLDLIEWTFDPLQAMNAHFNFAKLGCIADEYAVNFYGESTSALHRGTPTDRLVASWRIAEAHVVRRLEQSSALRARSHDVSAAPIVNPTALDGQWRTVSSIDLSRDDRRVWIEIPTGFTEMQQQAPDRALQWRMDLRQMFEAYFSRGYRAVDFVLQREAGFGRYLLAKHPWSAESPG
jgi:chorismate synthase